MVEEAVVAPRVTMQYEHAIFIFFDCEIYSKASTRNPSVTTSLNQAKTQPAETNYLHMKHGLSNYHT